MGNLTNIKILKPLQEEDFKEKKILLFDVCIFFSFYTEHILGRF